MNDPTSFALTDAYKRRVSDAEDASSAPLAFVLPTTPTTVRAAEAARAGIARTVAGKASRDIDSAAQVLRDLRSGRQLPLLLVFSDQLLAPADATMCVRSDSGDRYLSPFEVILNAKYGYALEVWTHEGFLAIAPCDPDATLVPASLIRYLDDCQHRLEDWQVRDLQALRSPTVRMEQAARKLRFYRSAVVNAYREEPEDPFAQALLRRADALEDRLAAAGAAP